MFITDGCPVIHYYILIYLVGKKKKKQEKAYLLIPKTCLEILVVHGSQWSGNYCSKRHMFGFVFIYEHL